MRKHSWPRRIYAIGFCALTISVFSPTAMAEPLTSAEREDLITLATRALQSASRTIAPAKLTLGTPVATRGGASLVLPIHLDGQRLESVYLNAVACLEGAAGHFDAPEISIRGTADGAYASFGRFSGVGAERLLTGAVRDERSYLRGQGRTKPIDAPANAKTKAVSAIDGLLLAAGRSALASDSHFATLARHSGELVSRLFRQGADSITADRSRPPTIDGRGRISGDVTIGHGGDYVQFERLCPRRFGDRPIRGTVPV